MILPNGLGLQKLTAFLATTDGEKTKQFYEGILGLRLVSEDPFALVFDANGTTLRIQRVQTFTPHSFTALGWEVPDIATAVGALTDVSIQFEVFPGMGQDALGIWTAPSGARVAWFKDPEGNLLSLTQHE